MWTKVNYYNDDSQKSDMKRNKLIENGTKIATDKIIKQNERINKNLYFLYIYIYIFIKWT